MSTEVGIQAPGTRQPRHLKAIRISPRLASFVDGMWEWDVPDADAGRSITGKLLPSVAPQFAIRYGAPMVCDRAGVGSEYRQIAHGVQTKVVTGGTATAARMHTIGARSGLAGRGQ